MQENTPGWLISFYFVSLQRRLDPSIQKLLHSKVKDSQPLTDILTAQLPGLGGNYFILFFFTGLGKFSFFPFINAIN